MVLVVTVLGLLFLAACLVGATLALGALGWAAARRDLRLCGVAAVALAITAPGGWWTFSVARAYRVPAWSTLPPLPTRFVGATQQLTLHADGRYLWVRGEEPEVGGWTAAPATGTAPTATAWTVTLAPGDGGPTRSLGVRWDGRTGLDGAWMAPR